MEIKVTLNGKKTTLNAEPLEKFSEVLKKQGLLSIRTSCDGQGYCGACNIIIDGVKKNSCQMVFGQIENGAEILTIEGLSKGRELHPIEIRYRTIHGRRRKRCVYASARRKERKEVCDIGDDHGLDKKIGRVEASCP